MQVVTSLKIRDIRPPRWNPRRSADPERLQDLASSVRAHGVIEPLVVRKIGADDHKDICTHELLCGSRRLEAARRAGHEHVPVTEWVGTDQDAEEVSLVENLQTESLHPIDEALAYRRLHQHGDGDGGDSLASLAKRVGKTKRLIAKRLALLDLSEEVQEAFAAGRIRLGHAERMCLVPDEKQHAALKECFYPLFGDDDGMEPAPVSKLEEWIAEYVSVQCDAETVEIQFPDLPAPPEKVETMVKLSESYHAGADLNTKKHGLINASSWVEIHSKKDECGNEVEGVIVHGGPMRVLRVCHKRGCPKHRPPKKKPVTSAGVTPDSNAKPSWEIENEKRAAERHAWNGESPGLLAAFADSVADIKLDAALIGELIGEYSLKRIVPLLKGKALSPENLGQAVALSMVTEHMWTRTDFIAATKPFGFKTPRRAKKKVTRKKPTVKKKAKKKTKKVAAPKQ